MALPVFGDADNCREQSADLQGVLPTPDNKALIASNHHCPLDVLAGFFYFKFLEV
jgi:hypothetical protein